MRPAVLFVLAGVPGCQLVNEVDLSFLDASIEDAGADSDVDTDSDTDVDPCDFVPCGGQGDCVLVDDAPRCECNDGFVEVVRKGVPTCEPAAPPEDCTAPGDEDADGFEDCSDFDCVGASECCGGEDPAPAVDEPFSDGFETGEWLRFAEGARSEPLSAPGGLREMGDYPEGNGMFFGAPVDFSGGAEIAMVARSDPGDDCASIAGCANYIGFALTRVITFVEGVPLPTSFAVYVAPQGRILVTRGGVTLARAQLPPATFDVVARITPGSTEGRSGFAVAVDARETGAKAYTRVYTSGGPVLAPEDNLRIDGSNGASFAVLGRTADAGLVLVQSIRVTPLACANPAGWTRLAVADRETLDPAQGEWTAGGVGAPSAAPTGAGDRVRLLFDASNLDPFFEIYGDVKRSVGEAEFDASGGVGEFFGGGPGPVVGQDPPNCVEGGCPEDPDQPLDARRPGIFRSGPFTYAWIVEAEGQEIHLFQRGASWSPYQEPPVWVAADWGLESITGVAGAVRARGVDELCVFVVGPSDGEPGGVHAACAGSVEDLAAAEIGGEAVVPSETFGALAGRGIRTAAVTFDPVGAAGETDDVFRFWAVVEDAVGETSVVHAAVDAGLAPGSVQPYAGNPVLRADSEFLGGCDRECRFSGVGVVELAAQRQFFVGRQQDAEATTFEVFALDQPRAVLE